MPYDRNADLPERVRNTFGAKGQEAYRKAFNAAWAGTCRGGGRQGNREACSHAVATTAAKRTESMQKAAEFFKALFGLDNGEPDKMVEADVGNVVIAKAGRVVKASDERQVIYVPVLIAGVEDSQGDIVDSAEIEKAAYQFAREYALGLAELGLDHESTLDRRDAYIVESWLEKADVDYGDEVVPKGSWMLGIHIADKELWKSTKQGDRTGASIEGLGVREAL